MKKILFALIIYFLSCNALIASNNIINLKEHDYITNAISKEGEVDIYKITLKYKSKVKVESSFIPIIPKSKGIYTDTYGYILDKDYNVIAEDDDSGYKAHFKIVKKLKPGTYYIKVRGYDEFEVGEYALKFDAFRYDPEGESIKSAYPYKLFTTHSAMLDENGDIDIYSITVNDNGEINLYTEGSTDTYCYLLDKDGNQIAEDDDNGKGTNCSIKMTLNKGKYYFKVRGYTEDEIGSYRLNSNFKYSNNNKGKSFDSAVTINLNSTKYGKLKERGDVFYYKFTLDKPMIVKVCHPDYGIAASVYYSNYNAINEKENFIYYNKNEFGGITGYCDGDNRFSITSLHQVLDEGTYYIKVKNAIKNNSYYLKLYASPIKYIGNSLEDAYNIEEKKVYSAAIEAFDDIDIYSFTLNKKETIGLSISTPRYVKYKWSLLDENGNEVNIKKRTYNKLITTLNAGKYYIKFEPIDKLYTYSLSYRKLSLINNVGNSLETAYPIKENQIYTVFIQDINSPHYYSINLDKTTHVNVQFSGGIYNIKEIPRSYTILDSNGNIVTHSKLEPGKYFIKVSGFSKYSYTYKIKYKTY